MNKPMIITLTGPACSGKSTLEKSLTSHGCVAAVSTTTRKPRDGEVQGKAYHFVDKETFLKIDSEQGLIERVEFNGNLYGITVGEVVRITLMGRPTVVVCEPHGQRQIAAYAEQKGWKLVSIFLDAPLQTITERYLKRFLQDNEKNGSEATVVTYAKRLATLIETETSWSKDQSDYDLYIPEYSPKTEHSVSELIKSLLSVP